ncbi:hypothetical protein P5673_010696 [Acropora cervicornis]|uniref:Uncharacterized protein n=1 Tax=Acropora cervicornis TaxID=6130 RepID=A0AAD9QQJ4_ACRCE|nr:hypothetical protein P5673_010696 [Acropora cervicornis]
MSLVSVNGVPANTLTSRFSTTKPSNENSRFVRFIHRVDDRQLCREIMVTNPFSAKRKTSDRKRLWETIARNLMKINSPKFKTSLSERAVRERYMRIAQRFKTKMNEEIKASRISPAQSELDVLLEELTEREEMAEEERFQQGKKSEKDQEKAKDI